MRTGLPEISETTVEQSIAKAVAEVFQTMIGDEVVALGRTPSPPLHSRPPAIEGPHAVASVGFVGDINGIINLHFDAEAAATLAGRMVGMTPEEVEANEVLADALGELANMTVGVFKNAIGDLGYCCKLTLPSIIRGNNFYVDHGVKAGSRHIFHFQWREKAVITDIIIKED